MILIFVHTFNATFFFVFGWVIDQNCAGTPIHEKLKEQISEQLKIMQLRQHNVQETLKNP